MKTKEELYASELKKNEEFMAERERRINFDAFAALIDGAIRILYNSEKKTFLEIFGPENGSYLWDKFTNHYKANEGAFICYLDYENQRKLAEAAVDYAEKNDTRATW